MFASRKSKTVGLFSGGLDSILAARLMVEQGVEVIGLHFRVPFPSPERDFTNDRLMRLAESAGVSAISVDVTDDYMKLIEKPAHGYARGMAPCLDCMLYMLTKAKELAEQVSADFIFTGEVVGQRSHCQNKRSLKLLEKLGKMEGRLLRPLSAKLLEPTIPELTGIVRRERLLEIKGRSRRRQIRLASEFGILDYPQPAGGCLLTDANFGSRVKDAIQHGQLDPASRQLLMLGRHFRLESGAKVIVGRNKGENQRLEVLSRPTDVLCRPLVVVGPVALLIGAPVGKQDMELAARICARYSDAPRGQKVKVQCGDQVFEVTAALDEQLEDWLIQATRLIERTEDDTGNEGKNSKDSE